MNIEEVIEMLGDELWEKGEWCESCTNYPRVYSYDPQDAEECKYLGECCLEIDDSGDITPSMYGDGDNY